MSYNGFGLGAGFSVLRLRQKNGAKRLLAIVF
jgi:hypothetical protein